MLQWDLAMGLPFQDRLQKRSQIRQNEETIVTS